MTRAIATLVRAMYFRPCRTATHGVCPDDAKGGERAGGEIRCPSAVLPLALHGGQFELLLDSGPRCRAFVTVAGDALGEVVVARDLRARCEIGHGPARAIG